MSNFSLVFWSKGWHQKDILKLTDLYQSWSYWKFWWCQSNCWNCWGQRCLNLGMYFNLVPSSIKCMKIEITVSQLFTFYFKENIHKEEIQWACQRQKFPKLFYFLGCFFIFTVQNIENYKKNLHFIVHSKKLITIKVRKR